MTFPTRWSKSPQYLLKPSRATNQDWGEVLGVGDGIGVDLPKPLEVLAPVEVFGVGFGLPTSTAGTAGGSAD